VPPEATGAAADQASTGTQPQAGSTTAGQAPAAANGQAPAADAQSGTEGSTSTAGDGETAEAKAARLERENAELRRENAGHRTKASAAERAAQEAARAGMTEAEQATARAKELEEQNTALQAQLKDQALRGAALAAATKLGYRNPELAYRLVDLAAVEYTEAGEPKNVEKLLRELATSETYLVKASGQDFGGGNRGGTPDTQPTMNELVRAALGKG
jgi:hypothetical protein